MNDVTIGGFVVALGAALYWLLPPESELETLSETGAPSELSIQHLQALVRANDTDVHLRMMLARAQFGIGALDEAVHELNQIDPPTDPVRELRMRVAMVRFRARDASVDERVVEQAIKEVLGEPEEPGKPKVPTKPEHSTLEEAAGFALEIGHPALAAKVYVRLAHDDVFGRARWLADAARWKRASGNDAHAADLYAQAADATIDAPMLRERALLAVESAVASGDPERALRLAKRFRRVLPDDPELVSRVEQLTPKTAPLSALVQSNDPTVLKVQIVKALKRKDLSLARPLLERQLELQPDDVVAHERLAALSASVGDHARAYTEYRWLVDRGYEDYVDRAIAAARMTWQLDAVLELRQHCAKQPAPSETCILELAQAYEDVGNPDQAAVVLAANARRRGSRALWRRLAILAEHRFAGADAVEAWQHVASLAPLDGTDAWQAASWGWRMDAPREALNVLVAVPEGAPGRDLAYWNLTADLAWEVNDTPVLVRALTELRARGEHSEDIFLRIILAEESVGNYAGAATAALDAYRIRADPKMLFIAATLYELQRRDRELVTMLAGAAARDAELLERTEYWTFTASAFERLGDKAEACRAYEGRLRLEPDSVDHVRAVVQCVTNAGDRAAIERYVAEWGPRLDESPKLYPVFARALVRLKRGREALDLMRRHQPAADDYAWRMEVADIAEQIKDAAEAKRYREQALVILSPRMTDAIKEPRNSEARDAIVARAILARRLEGRAAAYRWLDYLIPAGNGPINDTEAAELAIWYYIEDENAKSARRILERTPGLSPESERNSRLALAMLEDDLGEIERLLPEIPASDSSRIDALIRVGRHAEAMREIDVAINSADVERERIRELRLERADLEEHVSASGRASYTLDALGPLLVHGPRLDAAIPFNRLRFEASARWNELSSSSTFPIGAFSELQGNLALGYGTLRSNTRLEVGVNTRDGVTLPQASLSYAYKFGPRLSTRAELAYQSVPIDTLVIRAVGVRNTGQLEIGLDLTSRDRIELQGFVFQEQTMHKGALGTGAEGTLTVSHRLLNGTSAWNGTSTWNSIPEWNVYARGSVLGRSLSASAAMSLDGVGIPNTTPADGLLPETVSTAAIGTRFEHGDPASPWGRTSFPRYSVEVSGGRRWPNNAWSFEARAGVGTRVFGGDVLGLSAYYGRGLIGSASDAFRGGLLYYALGL